MTDRSLTRLIFGGALIASGFAAIALSFLAIQIPWQRWWALQAFNTLDDDAKPEDIDAVREQLRKADALSATVDPDLRLALADIAIARSQPPPLIAPPASDTSAASQSTAPTGNNPAGSTAPGSAATGVPPATGTTPLGTTTAAVAAAGTAGGASEAQPAATPAQPMLTPAQMQAERLLARELLRSVVRVRPGDAIAWYNLATVEQGDGPLSPAGHRDFAMSIRTGRAVGQLVFPRLTFCAAYWAQLSKSELDACHEQVRLATGPLATAWPDYFAALPEPIRVLLEPVFKASNATLPALNSDGTLATPVPAGTTAPRAPTPVAPVSGAAGTAAPTSTPGGAAPTGVAAAPQGK